MLMTEEFALWKRFMGVQTLLGAADVDKVVASANMKVGSYTVAAHPGVPSRISVTQTAGDTADTPGTILVTGTDDTDKVISETIIPIAGSTVYGSLYFKTVTSVVGAGWVIDGAEGTNDTITVGVSMDSQITAAGRSITFICVSGNIWINPLAAATEASTSFKLTAGQSIDLRIAEKLRFLADSSGATFQYIVWEQ